MNVDKMRRQATRIAERAEQVERAAWLKTLTPEHRRIHETRSLPFCMTCMQDRINELNMRMMAHTTTRKT